MSKTWNVFVEYLVLGSRWKPRNIGSDSREAKSNMANQFKVKKEDQEGKRQTFVLGPVDRGFCPAQSCRRSVPKKHTEAYINYKLFDLLAQAYY